MLHLVVRARWVRDRLKHLARITAPLTLSVIPGTLFRSAAIAAQEPTVEVITGHVVGPDGVRLPGVSVRATDRGSGVSRGAISSANGRFTIAFPDGGGSYQLEARFVGLQPAHKVVSRQGDDQRILADITLDIAAPTLGRVVTQGERSGRLPSGSGGSGTALTPDAIQRLPIDNSNPAAVAALTPGVVPVTSDTTVSSFSVAGQLATLNRVTLDGTTFGGSSLPSEALRSTHTITNTYDVARGQFSGGLIAATTQGGTNTTIWSLAPYLRLRDLSTGTDAPPTSTQLRSQQQLSGNFGSALVSDRLFTFTAFQLSRRFDQSTSLLNTDATSLLRAGVSPDSIRRFLNILQRTGVPEHGSGSDGGRDALNATVFERLDYVINDAHTLTIRGDFHDATRQGVGVGAFGVATSGGETHTLGGGGFASLTSQVSSRLINEFKASGSIDRRDATPYLTAPDGSVDLTQNDAILLFGGNEGFPQHTTSGLLEAAEEMSWFVSGAHTLRFGGQLDAESFQPGYAPGRLGTFGYHSLDDFEAGRPDVFSRTLNATNPVGSQVRGALYAADTWAPSDVLRVNYGARVESSSYGHAPPFNPEVFSLFARRTNELPAEVSVSPRAGFAWAAANDAAGRAITVLRGGIGEFQAVTPTSIVSDAQQATGRAGSEIQVVCTGATVPVPDWSVFVKSLASIPVACIGPQNALDSLAGTSLPTVATFARHFRAPRAWRGSVGLRQLVLPHLRITVDANYARGLDLPGVSDLNLKGTPTFTLSNEANRPVYVPAGTIDPGTGATGLVASRVYPQFGHVYSLNSNLQSDTRQIISAVHGTVLGGIAFQLSYTWSQVRDQSSFAGGHPDAGFSSPTTAGDPNHVEWARSSLERRHSVLGIISIPIPSGEVATIGRLSSGIPYTPHVGGDINGDGVGNDRAFVFDPRTTTDPSLIAGMTQLLSTAPSRVRDCLLRQLGHIAARNSCLGPWLSSLDFQVNVRPRLPAAHRLTLSLIAANALTGRDALLHGSHHMLGWGQPTIPDPDLLLVQGFDANARRFIYTVNPRFGQSYNGRQAAGVPFQIALQARVEVGQR
jgi:hypothetical protein